MFCQDFGGLTVHSIFRHGDGSLFRVVTCHGQIRNTSRVFLSWVFRFLPIPAAVALKKA